MGFKDDAKSGEIPPMEPKKIVKARIDVECEEKYINVLHKVCQIIYDLIGVAPEMICKPKDAFDNQEKDALVAKYFSDFKKPE